MVVSPAAHAQCQSPRLAPEPGCGKSRDANRSGASGRYAQSVAIRVFEMYLASRKTLLVNWNAELLEAVNGSTSSTRSRSRLGG
jgi:hypothetical protein